MVLMAILHRYLSGEGFQWGQAAGIGAGAFVVWLTLAALQKSGWWDRQFERRQERYRQEQRWRDDPWQGE